jgi:hypothetical protein
MAQSGLQIAPKPAAKARFQKYVLLVRLNAAQMLQIKKEKRPLWKKRAGCPKDSI